MGGLGGILPKMLSISPISTKMHNTNKKYLTLPLL
jgi:hypothetical protein